MWRLERRAARAALGRYMAVPSLGVVRVKPPASRSRTRSWGGVWHVRGTDKAVSWRRGCGGLAGKEGLCDLGFVKGSAWVGIKPRHPQ